MAGEQKIGKKMYSPSPKSVLKAPTEEMLQEVESPEWFKNESMDLQMSMADQQERFVLFETEPRVLLVYCSGSFGCTSSGAGYQYNPGDLDRLCRSFKLTCDPEFTTKHGSMENWIFTPLTVQKRRIRYKVREMRRVKASADMSIESVLELGGILREEYYNFDAFIILHGSDTVSYVASILSFMLENLRKTVIMTSCLIPLTEMRNDAESNLVTAITIAGNYWIPEVTVLFNNALFRGNRIVKHSSYSLESIRSPQAKPLARIGSLINISWSSILLPKSKEAFRVSLELEPNVSIITVFPFMTAEAFRSAFEKNIKGVIIETYGSGNFPTNREELDAIIKEAISRGVVVMNVSQCKKGDVSAEYEGAVLLCKMGVITAYDMTMECTLAKLSYLLGKKYPVETVKKLIVKNLRGEITNTSDLKSFTVHSATFVKTLSSIALEALPRGKTECKVLPTLLTEATALGQMECLAELKKGGHNIDVVDYEKRSLLHTAAIFGKNKTAGLLIEDGISVNSLDNEGNSPLFYAVKHRNYELARLLHLNGAVLTTSAESLLKLVLNAGCLGKVQRLKSLKECEVDIASICDRHKRSTAHHAALNSRSNVLNFLASEYPGMFRASDAFGHSPVDYVKDEKLLESLKAAA